MAIEQVVNPTTLEESIGALVTIFQIIGGLIGVYIIFWTISSFINARRNKVLRKILENVEEINKKLGRKK